MTVRSPKVPLARGFFFGAAVAASVAFHPGGLLAWRSKPVPRGEPEAVERVPPPFTPRSVVASRGAGERVDPSSRPDTTPGGLGPTAPAAKGLSLDALGVTSRLSSHRAGEVLALAPKQGPPPFRPKT